MGIRVHKFMGYGLDDVKPNDERFVIHPNNYSEFHDRLNDEEKQKEFIDHLFNLEKSKDFDRTQFVDFWTLYDLYREKKEITLNPYDFMTYESEYGLENVFVIKPIFGFDDWKRYDDMIDAHSKYSQKNDVEVQRWNCLYPFQGFVDAKTGKTINSRVFNAIRHINYCLDNKTNPDAPNDDWNSLYESSERKYKTFKEYEENVFPIKPLSIIEYTKFFNIFTDDKIVHTLKPMIYTYWS